VSQTLVLDAGALIAVERRSPQLQELICFARSRRASLVVPTAALVQVVRSGGRQANLRRFLADSYLRFVGLGYLAALFSAPDDLGATLQTVQGPSRARSSRRELPQNPGPGPVGTRCPVTEPPA